MLDAFLTAYYHHTGSPLIYSGTALKQALADVTAPALKALRAAEWNGGPALGGRCCSLCWEWEKNGHRADCLLKQALDSLESKS